ncbi:MAG: 2-amino-4-hydroxy-6-hydroxymethyldihydropteridine diphosphokinase [Hyphomicrobiales bacterium]|nr:2-amino-4-hydroxy-6-hydroxymethyldihydropteridine diphosphokinase [Hyphomicrobiales bacterium]
MADALIGLGGNLGDVATTFRAALLRLEAGGCRIVAKSSLWRTPPWGVTDQPAFLNACVRVETELAPRALLDLCLETETALGRIRLEKWGPRAIDLDLLDVDGLTVDEPGLTLPHPYLGERAFVLVPLAEIAPERRIAGRSVAEMAEAIERGGLERIGPFDAV